MAPPIEWTKDGPQGEERPEFAYDGLRFAVLQPDGTIEAGDRYTLTQFGGVVPSVGDRIAMLWPVGDPDSNEHVRVLARYYVGEFAGDYAWWLLVSLELGTERDERMFQIAREASIETRHISKERSDYYQELLRMRLEANKPKPKPKPKRPGRSNPRNRK